MAISAERPELSRHRNSRPPRRQFFGVKNRFVPGAFCRFCRRLSSLKQMSVNSAPARPVANGKAGDTGPSNSCGRRRSCWRRSRQSRAACRLSLEERKRLSRRPAYLLSGCARAAAAGEGQVAPAQGRQVAARRDGAGGDGHPEVAARKGVHHANVSPRAISNSTKSRATRIFAKSSSRRIATSAKGIIRPSTILRTALSVVRGTEFPQAHRTGGFARARWRCSPAGASKSVISRHQTAPRRRAT